MLISLSKRFVFVSVTKTGLTSVVEALKPYSEIQNLGRPHKKHMPMYTALSTYDFLFSDSRYPAASFFKFCVMREPLNWLFSWYRYRVGSRNIDSALDPSFSSERFWLLNDWNKWQDKENQKRFLQKSSFTNPNSGELLFDKVLKYENLEVECSNICRSLGLKAQLQKLNLSKPMHVQ